MPGTGDINPRRDTGVVALWAAPLAAEAGTLGVAGMRLRAQFGFRWGVREACTESAGGERDLLRQEWVEGTLREGEWVTSAAGGWLESLSCCTCTLFLVEKRSRIMNSGAPRVADGIVADCSTGPVFVQMRRNASEPSFHSVAAA
eukprot:2700546-Amphidinium_carterae.2